MSSKKEENPPETENSLGRLTVQQRILLNAFVNVTRIEDIHLAHMLLENSG